MLLWVCEMYGDRYTIEAKESHLRLKRHFFWPCVHVVTCKWFFVIELHSSLVGMQIKLVSEKISVIKLPVAGKHKTLPSLPGK